MTLYHGTDHKPDVGHSLRPDAPSWNVGGGEYGIYLSPRPRYARLYGRHLVEALASIKNPLVVEGKYEINPGDLTAADAKRLQRQGYDGIVVTSSTVDKASEVVAFNSKQVWVTDVR